jgi:hypothetical protein
LLRTSSRGPPAESICNTLAKDVPPFLAISHEIFQFATNPRGAWTESEIRNEAGVPLWQFARHIHFSSYSGIIP